LLTFRQKELTTHGNTSQDARLFHLHNTLQEFLLGDFNLEKIGVVHAGVAFF